CSRFAAVSQVKPATPVTFPPGCDRLVTNPPTSGSTEVITIGICLVASIAARVGGEGAEMMTSTFIRTNSAASPGSRSTFPAAERISSVAALLIAELAELLVKCRERRLRRFVQQDADDRNPRTRFGLADRRHRLLLRAQRGWPSTDRAG